MGLTSSDVIILVITTILSLITVLLVIWVAEEHMFVFGLRPSESVSTDIAGLITLSRGLTGDVEIIYSNITKEILYNVTIKDKLVCVTGKLFYTSTDCSSSTSNADDMKKVDGSDFKILIKKSNDKVEFPD